MDHEDGRKPIGEVLNGLRVHPLPAGWTPLEGSNRSFTNNGVWAGTITSGYFENYLFPPDPSALTWAEHRVNYFLGSNAGEWAWGYHILWGGELHDWLSPVIFARTP